MKSAQRITLCLSSAFLSFFFFFASKVNKQNVTTRLILFYSARRKRTTDRVTFTKKQVHILPGYPKQISKDPLLASLAFYLQSSAGSSNAVIKRETLVSSVKGSVASISNAVNGTISSVFTLLAVQPTIPTTKSTTATKTSQNGGIIAGCLFGSILLIAISGVIVWRYRYPNTRYETCYILQCLICHGHGTKNNSDSQLRRHKLNS